MIDWIKTSDELPDTSRLVLVFIGEDDYCQPYEVGEFSKNSEVWHVGAESISFDIGSVTHWAELQEPKD